MDLQELRGKINQEINFNRAVLYQLEYIDEVDGKILEYIKAKDLTSLKTYLRSQPYIKDLRKEAKKFAIPNYSRLTLNELKIALNASRRKNEKI